MTKTEQNIYEVAEKLARSLGHYVGCGQNPCTCGERQKQAAALDEWQHLKSTLQNLR